MKKDAYLVKSPPLPKSFGDTFLQLKKGKGVKLWDEGGKEYLDFGSGIAVNALGYGNSSLRRAIQKQAKSLIHTSNLYTTGPTLELAKELISWGDFSAVHFGNSGTEANEAAIKFARLYSLQRKGKGNHKILSFHGAFHGRTLGALSVTPTQKYKEPFEPLLPGTVHLELNDVEALEKTLDSTFAGVIVEPLQGEGGLNSLSGDFIEALNRLCKEHDVILIADEVQTGVGRTGSLLASTQIGLKPDIVTLSKPLGGGLPLSATLFPKKVNDYLELGHHGSTFGGGPLATAAALAVIKQIKVPGFLEAVKEKGEYFDQKLSALKEKYSYFKSIKGMGLLKGIELDEETAGFTLADLMAKARENGLLVLRCGKNVLRMAPPLIINKKEINQGFELLEKTLLELRVQGA